MVERPDRHERLPGRARRVLTLAGPGEQRVAGLLGVELLELLVGDATGPHRRVVRRLAGHRHDATRLRLHHHRCAAVGGVVAPGHLVEGAPRGRDRGVQLLLHVSLHLGVDRGDQRVTGLRLGLTRVAQHATHGVDRDQLAPGLTTQVGVVGLLDPGPADHRGAVDRVVLRLVRLVELALGDRAEIAEHVRPVDAVRRGVGAHALLLRQHPGVVLGLLQHLDRDLLLHVASHRDRLVGRAVPAGPLDRPG